MQLYKIKIPTVKTVENELTKIEHHLRGLVTIRAIHWSCENPNRALHLYDADGDEFIYPIPGQQPPDSHIEIVSKVTVLDTPLTVELPLSYVDEEGECELKIWGTVERPEKIDSGFDGVI